MLLSMDSLRVSIRNIFRKKMRSGLIISGIAIGVLSVIIISAIGDVGKRTINSELDSIGVGGVVLTADEFHLDTKIEQDQLDIINESDQVKDAMPLISNYTTCEILGKKTKCVLFGVDNQAKKMISLKVLHGRLINKNDILSRSDVCVVDENYAMKYYKRSNIVGKSISILVDGATRKFDIVGVVASGGNVLQNLMGNYIPCFMYSPYTTLQSYSGKKNFDQIMLKLKEGVDSGVITQTLVPKIEQSLDSENSIVVQNLVQQKEKLNNILNIVTMILSLIAGISLVVAGLSIMTVMLVSVSERTREIGIKKSIGASKGKILMEFLMETFLICLIGSIIGLTLGLLFAAIGCVIVGVEFIANIKMILFCTSFTITIGLIFGVYPAIKAAKLKPVDALRFE